MTTPSETDLIESTPEPLQLSDGSRIEVERLRFRGLMALLRILTNGAADLIFNIVSDDEEEFTQRIAMAVLFAVPEAPEQAIDFVKVMVRPAGLFEGHTLSKNERASNEERSEALREVLEDPEITDIITIVVAIVRNEAPHLAALGKQLRSLIETMGTQPTASETPKKSSRSRSAKSTQTAS